MRLLSPVDGFLSTMDFRLPLSQDVYLLQERLTLAVSLLLHHLGQQDTICTVTPPHRPPPYIYIYICMKGHFKERLVLDVCRLVSSRTAVGYNL